MAIRPGPGPGHAHLDLFIQHNLFFSACVWARGQALGWGGLHRYQELPFEALLAGDPDAVDVLLRDVLLVVATSTGKTAIAYFHQVIRWLQRPEPMKLRPPPSLVITVSPTVSLSREIAVNYAKHWQAKLAQSGDDELMCFAPLLRAVDLSNPSVDWQEQDVLTLPTWVFAGLSRRRPPCRP